MTACAQPKRVSIPAALARSVEETVLPAPYDSRPSPDAIHPSEATSRLVRSQVNALLTSSPAYHSLSAEDRRRLTENLVKIASYSAELIRDDWYQSEKIGQHPVLKKTEVLEPAVVTAQATADDGFQASAASRIGRVTKETLNAISFPTFVADLIKGSFTAIVSSSVEQMEAYIKLIENVSKTVDQFMNENISDNDAKRFLVDSYPNHLRLDNGNPVTKDGADENPPPNFNADLKLGRDVGLDESSIEEILVPAARRKLAQSRQEMLSTLVLMGINRIVVTGGKIRATMGFHIDTTDRLRQESGTDLDTRLAAAGSYGMGLWSVSASASVSYVSSTRQKSDSEMNVDADLTGEVEIHFKSDYFPLSRFANNATIGRIQSHTAVPENNAPGENTGVEPFREPPAVGGEIGKYTSSRTRRTPETESVLPKIGTPLQPARMPEKPVKPDDIHLVRKEEETEKKESKAETGVEKDAKTEVETKPEVKPEAEIAKPETEGETQKTETGEKKDEPVNTGETTKPAEEKPEADGIKEKAAKAVGEIGDKVKVAVADKAGDFVNDLIGNIGK